MSKTRRPGSDQRAIKDLPKDPNGRHLCRQCEKEVPKGRRSFCSAKCVDDYQVRIGDAGHIRFKLHQRDKGICSRCGINTEAIVGGLDEIAGLVRHYIGDKRILKPEDQVAVHKALESLRDALRIRFSGRTTLWDADHIKPVQEGGGGCSIDNFQTLCIWCHKLKTAEQAARQARLRRQEPAGQKPGRKR